VWRGTLRVVRDPARRTEDGLVVLTDAFPCHLDDGRWAWLGWAYAGLVVAFLMLTLGWRSR
jgi:hypothetical protein